MFDLDPSSKRVQLALRFFTYGVMTISTIVISVIMVFFALGYRLDNNFHFTQGGLVQFLSTPNNALVTVDGVQQGLHTPDKMNISAGQHMIGMSLAGYRSWSKTIDLAAGQLLWLNYIRLIPNTIVTSSVHDFDTLASAVASPDHRWFLLQPKNDSPEFTLMDISDETSPKFTQLQLPDSALTKQDGKYGTFTVVEWDLGSQYVLIKHQVGTTTEFIRMDRSNPGAAVNITNLFGFDISAAHFSGSNPNSLFVNTSGVLRSLDIGNQSASGALVDGLQDFVVYGQSTIAFTASQEQTSGDATTTQHVLGTWRNDKTTIVRSVGMNANFLFAYSEYDNHEYLAFTTTGSTTVSVLRDPSNSSTKEPNTIFAQFDLGVVPQWLSFSENGRMVVAQNGNHFASYDVEEAKSYKQVLALGADIKSPLRWFDDFYLWADDGNKLRLVEFDGTNERDITPVQSGFGIVISSNNKRLFSVNKNAKTSKFVVQTTLLTTQH